MKTYKIDLSNTPETRWDTIFNENNGSINRINNFMESEINNEFPYIIRLLLFPILYFLINVYGYFTTNEYIRELKGISKFGMSFSKLVLINYGYDFVAHCTSVVCFDKQNNKVWHLRNMDWSEVSGSDNLRHLTTQIDVYKDDQLLFKCTTWLGFVGVLTGIRCQRVDDNTWYPMTISLNYRKEGRSKLNNIFKILRNYNPCSFAIRRVLENYKKNITNYKLVAPCYITTGFTNGLKVYELGSDRLIRYYYNNTELFHGHCDVNNDKYAFMVQTNNDYTMDIVDEAWANSDPLLLNTIDRKQSMIANLTTFLQNNKLTVEACNNLMKIEPVFNNQTIYTTIMSFDKNSFTYDNVVY
jgi:hypothetical protein